MVHGRHTHVTRFTQPVVVCLLLALASTACSRRSPARAPAVGSPPLRLAVSLQTPSALALLAWKNGSTEASGLRTEITTHVSGSRALAALLAGEADLATAADVPVAFAAFSRGDFRILACIGTSDDECSIVARQDRGIRAPSDLRGKVIGTQKASAVHFFLHSFLVHNRIADTDVTVRYMKAEELPAALAAGDLDAFSMREPYVSQAIVRLGTNAVAFHAPGLYFRHELLLARADALRAEPAALRAVIAVLLAAERRAQADPEGAIRGVAAALGVERREAEAHWSDLDLRIGLDQSVITALEDQARWAVRAGLVDGPSVPNFLPLIEWRILNDAHPDRSGIIH